MELIKKQNIDELKIEQDRITQQQKALDKSIELIEMFKTAIIEFESNLKYLKQETTDEQ